MKKVEISALKKPISCIALGTDGFGVGKSVTAAEELLDLYVENGGNAVWTGVSGEIGKINDSQKAANDRKNPQMFYHLFYQRFTKTPKWKNNGQTSRRKW